MSFVAPLVYELANPGVSSDLVADASLIVGLIIWATILLRPTSGA